MNDKQFIDFINSFKKNLAIYQDNNLNSINNFKFFNPKLEYKEFYGHSEILT